MSNSCCPNNQDWIITAFSSSIVNRFFSALAENSYPSTSQGLWVNEVLELEAGPVASFQLSCCYPVTPSWSKQNQYCQTRWQNQVDPWEKTMTGWRSPSETTFQCWATYHAIPDRAPLNASVIKHNENENSQHSSNYFIFPASLLNTSTLQIHF